MRALGSRGCFWEHSSQRCQPQAWEGLLPKGTLTFYSRGRSAKKSVYVLLSAVFPLCLTSLLLTVSPCVRPSLCPLPAFRFHRAIATKCLKQGRRLLLKPVAPLEIAGLSHSATVHPFR